MSEGAAVPLFYYAVGVRGRKMLLKFEARERNKTLNGLSVSLSVFVCCRFRASAHMQNHLKCSASAPARERFQPIVCHHHAQLFQYFIQSGWNLHVHSIRGGSTMQI